MKALPQGVSDDEKLQARRAELLASLFLNRTDRVAILAPWGKPCPVDPGDSVARLLRTHLSSDTAETVTVACAARRRSGPLTGRFRVGSYGPALDGTTKWLCIDLDGAGHADGQCLAEPDHVAAHILNRARSLGMPACLERSGGGRGWHVWVFFETPIDARTARTLGFMLVPTDAQLVGGSIADPVRGKGIEIFPKHDRIPRNGLGSCVWFPWWSGAPEGACQFYSQAGNGGFVPAPDGCLTPLSVDDAHRIAETTDHVLPPRRARRDGAARRQDASDWRQEALRTLPLESVYGRWLTGQSQGGGWLQCRDPWSPSGDANPSAGVADGTGEAERGAFHSFISGRTMSVFDFAVERGLAPDFAGARAYVAELAGVKTRTGPIPRPAGTELPEIQVNDRQLPELAADAWGAVAAANQPPTLFVRDRQLVQVVPGQGTPRIEAMGENQVCGYVARRARWVRSRGTDAANAIPSKELVRDMLAYPDPRLPLLDSICTVPVFGVNGALLTSSGYHAEARCWLELANEIASLDVPGHPAQEQVRAAVELIDEECLGDFDLASQADRAHAVAALLLPFVRRMIPGSTPLHLIESPVPGSGKTLLADVFALIATGQTCSTITLANDETEVSKMITSVLMSSPVVVLLDNVRGGIDSSQLAAALTSETWSGRLLGHSRMVQLRNQTAWLATGNNPNLSSEVMRRCVRIRLDPKDEHPWTRTGFRHNPLRSWVRGHRPMLIHAALVIIQNWIAVGRPLSRRGLGSFEGWSAIMGGILEAARVQGFLDNLDELYAAASLDAHEWRSFVETWWETHGEGGVCASDLNDLCEQHHLLNDVRGAGGPRSQQTCLGKALHTARDRIIGTWQLVGLQPDRKKRMMYSLRGTGPSVPRE
jgi:hypothetical protein